MLQRTFALIKPEGLEDAQILSDIFIRIQAAALRVVKGKACVPYARTVMDHYQDQFGRSHFSDLVNDIAGHIVIAMVLEGENAIDVWRTVVGPYQEDLRSLPEHQHSIRGANMQSDSPLRRNFVHGSTSEAEALREIEVWEPYM